MKEKFHVIYAEDKQGNLFPVTSVGFDSLEKTTAYMADSFTDLKPNEIIVIKGIKFTQQIVLKEEVENERIKTEDC